MKPPATIPTSAPGNILRTFAWLAAIAAALAILLGFSSAASVSERGGGDLAVGTVFAAALYPAIGAVVLSGLLFAAAGVADATQAAARLASVQAQLLQTIADKIQPDPVYISTRGAGSPATIAPKAVPSSNQLRDPAAFEAFRARLEAERDPTA